MRPSPFHLRVVRFTFDNLALTYNKFMQLVTPSVVAMAVRMAASVWMMNFQVAFFMVFVKFRVSWRAKRAKDTIKSLEFSDIKENRENHEWRV